jgi:hypothetical protein
VSRPCKPNKETTLAVSEAIRERIRNLEEELEHWRKLLARCVKDGLSPSRPRSAAPERRPRLVS